MIPVKLQELYVMILIASYCTWYSMYHTESDIVVYQVSTYHVHIFIRYYTWKSGKNEITK